MAKFTAEDVWSSDTLARNPDTGEEVGIGGKDGRLDYSIYDASATKLNMTGVTNPEGVAVSWIYKGAATFGTDGLPTFTTFRLPDQPSFLDLTADGEDYPADVKVMGGAGNDVVWSGDGADALSGAGGDDRLFGGGGNDVLAGASGADTLTGWTGDDELFGADGEAADGAADVFVYYGGIDGGNGNDTIHDFEAGIDKIDLSRLGIEDPAGFVAASVANGDDASRVDLGENGSITVQLAAGSALGESDFIFA